MCLLPVIKNDNWNNFDNILANATLLTSLIFTLNSDFDACWKQEPYKRSKEHPWSLLKSTRAHHYLHDGQPYSGSQSEADTSFNPANSPSTLFLIIIKEICTIQNSWYKIVDR